MQESHKCSEERGTISSFHVLPMFLLVQPWLLLAFLAARAHCWSMPRLPSASTPSSSSVHLLPMQSCAAQQTFLSHKTQHLSWLNFRKSIVAHSISLTSSSACLCPSGLQPCPQLFFQVCPSICSNLQLAAGVGAFPWQQYNIYNLCLFHIKVGAILPPLEFVRTAIHISHKYQIVYTTLYTLYTEQKMGKWLMDVLNREK